MYLVSFKPGNHGELRLLSSQRRGEPESPTEPRFIASATHPITLSSSFDRSETPRNPYRHSERRSAVDSIRSREQPRQNRSHFIASNHFPGHAAHDNRGGVHQTNGPIGDGVAGRSPGRFAELPDQIDSGNVRQHHRRERSLRDLPPRERVFGLSLPRVF